MSKQRIMSYKVTLCQNNPWCRRHSDIEDCLWTRTVKADSKFQAAWKVITPYLLEKPRDFHHTDHPIVYEIIEGNEKNPIKKKDSVEG